MNTTQVPHAEFVGIWDEQIVATAIHTGHDLRDETRALMVLDEDVRFREEDPFTHLIGQLIPARVVVNRSRFEVDINRDRENAVYQSPDDCWGLEVWQNETLPDDAAERSRELHDQFYAALAERLDEVAARGPFVVYDVHSYNHRRNGADAEPEPQEDNPTVNVGTGSLDRDRWGGVVDAFMESLASADVQGEKLDVRENVKFKGAQLCRWVHERYPETGVALALEFKKTYMDEWTGEPDADRIAALSVALEGTMVPVAKALEAAGGAR